MINLKDPNKRMVVISGGASVLVLGALGYLGWTDWQEIGTLRGEHDSLRTAIAKADTEIQQVGDIEDRVLVLRERVKDHAAILPDDSEIYAFVDKLTEFARQSGVTVTGLDDTAAKQRKTKSAATREAFDRVTYKLKLVASTASFIKFLDLFENKYERFVNIPSFKLKGGEFDDKLHKAADDVRHELDLEIETYVYNPKAKTGDVVPIPKEQAKLERLRASGRLNEPGNDIKLVRYDYREVQGRRDPFVDPRLSLAANGKISEELRRQQFTALEEAKKLWQGVLDQIAKEMTAKDPIARIQAQEATNASIRDLSGVVDRHVSAKTFTVSEFQRDFADSVEAPLRALQAERGTGTGFELSLADIETRVAEMETSLEKGAYDRVVALHREVTELRPRIPVSPEGEPLWQRAEAAHKRAGTYMEFAAKEIAFGGCIVSDDDPSRSVIIVNGRSFSPGESVEEGLVITAIKAHEITFDFRGLKVTRSHGDK